MLLHVIRFEIITHIRKHSLREATDAPVELRTLLGLYLVLEVLNSTLGPKMS